MKRIATIFLISLTIFSLYSCAEHITESAPTIFDNIVDPEVVNGNFADIQAKVFTPSCAVAGCHVSGVQAPNLSAGVAYNNIVNIRSGQNANLFYIDPNDPDLSYLYLKIIGDPNAGAPMPQNAAPLSQAVQDSIRAWISRGALNDSGQAPPDTMLPPTPVNMRAEFMEIQDSIFNISCATSGCHVSGAQTPDLSAGVSYDNIIFQSSQGNPSLSYINPGNPNQSYLYLKLIGDASISGQQMPRGGSPLAQALLDSFALWIAKGAPDENGMTPVPPMNMRARFSQIQDSVFTPSCATAGCHNGTVNPNLTVGNAYNNIVGENSSQGTDYIDPGDPDDSYLYLKMINDPSIAGNSMPRGQDLLKQSILDSIRVWIENGADNNAPPPNLLTFGIDEKK